MPGTDTNGWGLIPLGEACQVNPKKGQDKRLVSGLTVSFVPMPAVSEKGEIDPSETREYDTVRAGFTYFAENDVLFAKITPCMENGKGAVARGLYSGIGFGSTEFHVLRPISGKTNPYWLYMLTAFSQFREDAANNMTGSAGQRRVPASFLENYQVSVPPMGLQEQFAAFVVQIDKSKFDLKQSLEKLEMLKKSLMQQYFG
jgi:type I restriction enzyme S subunit